MAQEIERKYLLDDLPDGVDDLMPTPIAQGYLAGDEHVEVRIRARGDDRLLTVKGGHGEVRTEVTVPLTAEQFDALWPLTAGRRLRKRRWVLPADDIDVEVEVDAFDGDLDGLLLAEVEFDSVAASRAFVPPDWFGADVTDDERYRNAMLARHGPPDRTR